MLAKLNESQTFAFSDLYNKTKENREDIDRLLGVHEKEYKWV